MRVPLDTPVIQVAGIRDRAEAALLEGVRRGGEGGVRGILSRRFHKEGSELAVASRCLGAPTARGAHGAGATDGPLRAPQ